MHLHQIGSGGAPPSGPSPAVRLRWSRRSILILEEIARGKDE